MRWLFNMWRAWQERFTYHPNDLLARDLDEQNRLREVWRRLERVAQDIRIIAEQEGKNVK